MATKTITVLFVDAPEWPNHSSDRSVVGTPRGIWCEWRGKPVKVHAEPIDAKHYRSCDSDVVWRVTDESVKAICGANAKLHPPYFVCRHQIQAEHLG